MNPTCQQMIALLIDFVSGELDATVEGEFRQHLCGCLTCYLYVQTYQATITVTRSLPRDEPLPPGLEERLRERMRAAAADGE